jgi:ornithine cyclodeaminase/alanine dehydrogenase-like protein (mu-crystallin family)
VVALFDARGRRPLALMDSIELTALRTAAMTAVAARRLARADARTATICGCGLQGRVSCGRCCACGRCSASRCWDVAPAAAKRFAREMSRELGIPVERARAGCRPRCARAT